MYPRRRKDCRDGLSPWWLTKGDKDGAGGGRGKCIRRQKLVVDCDKFRIQKGRTKWIIEKKLRAN